MWRDRTGRILADYPHPSVAVDVVLLTVERGRLAVALHRRDGYAAGSPALPGRVVRIEETLAEAALRALDQRLGVTGRAPTQLAVFDAVDRDDRGRVVSVAHVDLVGPEVLATLPPSAWVVGVDELPALAFDHAAMIEAAVDHVRRRHRHEPDPARLLDEPFSLAELRTLHEHVLGVSLPRDTFRRQVLPALVETGERRTGVVGKPARLFRHC